MAHNLARWTTRIGLGEQLATTKTLRRRFFSLAGRLTRSARRPPCTSAPGLALAEPVWDARPDSPPDGTHGLVRRLPLAATTPWFECKTDASCWWTWGAPPERGWAIGLSPAGQLSRVE